MFYNRVLSEVRKKMKNQNNLMILLVIPTVCASDSSDTADSVALPSSDAIVSVDLESGNASAIAGATDSPLSSPNSNDANSTDKDDSNAVLSTTNNEILSANPDGTFSDLQSILRNTPLGGTVVLDRNYVQTDYWGDILIPRAMTIDGNGFTIDAKDKSRIFYTNSKNVDELVLKNIVFINGFISSSSMGGAIYFNSQLNRIVIENCTFINCTSGKNGAAVAFTKPVSNSNISAKFIEY